MRKLLTSVSAIAIAACTAFGVAKAVNVPLVSGINNLDPSTEQAIINALIQAFNFGTTGNLAFVPGPVNAIPTTVAQNLATALIPIGQLTSAGQGVRVRCGGTSQTNADSKTPFIQVGGGSVITATAFSSGAQWDMDLVWQAATSPVTANYVYVGHAITASASNVVAGQDTVLTDNNFSFNVPVRCGVILGTSQTADVTLMSFTVEQIK